MRPALLAPRDGCLSLDSSAGAALGRPTAMWRDDGACVITVAWLDAPPTVA